MTICVTASEQSLEFSKKSVQNKPQNNQEIREATTGTITLSAVMFWLLTFICGKWLFIQLYCETGGIL